MNNVSLTGRLTADPELRVTTNNTSVCSFTIAVDRPYKSGEEKTADFLDCVAWRNTAEFVEKYFKKGKSIAVTGSIRTRLYQDKDGNNRKAVEILVENVEFCGNKGE